jgi:hypothetical protein
MQQLCSEVKKVNMSTVSLYQYGQKKRNHGFFHMELTKMGSLDLPKQLYQEMDREIFQDPKLQQKLR